MIAITLCRLFIWNSERPIDRQRGWTDSVPSIIDTKSNPHDTLWFDSFSHTRADRFVRIVSECATHSDEKLCLQPTQQKRNSRKVKGNTRKADEENPTRNMFYMTADKFMIKYRWADKKFCMHEQMTYASPDDVSHVPAGHATYSHAQFYSCHGDSARTYMTSTNLTINSFNFYAKFAYLHVNWLKMFRSSSHFLQSPFGAFGETTARRYQESTQNPAGGMGSMLQTEA